MSRLPKIYILSFIISIWWDWKKSGEREQGIGRSRDSSDTGPVIEGEKDHQYQCQRHPGLTIKGCFHSLSDLMFILAYFGLTKYTYHHSVNRLKIIYLLPWHARWEVYRFRVSTHAPRPTFPQPRWEVE